LNKPDFSVFVPSDHFLFFVAEREDQRKKNAHESTGKKMQSYKSQCQITTQKALQSFQKSKFCAIVFSLLITILSHSMLNILMVLDTYVWSSLSANGRKEKVVGKDERQRSQACSKFFFVIG